MSKKSILKGTVIISLAGLIARLIGLFFRIPLTAMIGEEGIGIYSFPMILFVPLAAIVIQGPPTVIAKFISESNALHDDEEVACLYKASQMLMLKVGFTLSAIMLIMTPFLVNYVWSKKLLYPYLVLCPVPIILSVTAVYIGYYQGIQDMRVIAIQHIFNGFGRLIFGLTLAYIALPIGIIASATAAVSGTTIGALCGFLAIYVFHKQNKALMIRVTPSKENRKDLQIKILKKAIPITVGAIGASLVPLVDAFLMYNRLGAAGYSDDAINSFNGILSNVNALMSVPLIIGVAIGTSIVPNIAAAKISGNQYLQGRIRASLILAISLALPCGIGLFLVGKPVFRFLYPLMSNDHYIIEVLSIGIIFIMINQALIAILQGTDHERLPVKNFYLSLIVKIVLSFILLGIPEINIHGAAISTMITYIIITIFNLLTVRRLLHFKIDFKYMIFLPIFNTVLMAIGVVFINWLGAKYHKEGLFSLISILTGTSIYGILLLTTKIVHIKDIPLLNRLNIK